MQAQNSPRKRGTFPDYLRAVGYAALGAWSVLFLLFPPTAFVDNLDLATRIFWMSVTFIGTVLGFFGAVFRIDLKMELPGLVIMIIGPVFYAASQLYYVFVPGAAENPSNRVALVVYAIIPALFLLPRIYDLWVQSRKLKNLNTASIRVPLTEAQASQPGAFSGKEFS